MSSPTAQYTDFGKDVLARYICNGLDEALASTTGRPDAKPFDIVIVGAGSFGGALAQHLLYSDKSRVHRILVLEAGPFVLAEHTQNMPTLGLAAPGPTASDPGVARAEVWGLPWRTDVPQGFPGLAYCLGGRSLFWGGWSPELLDAEMPASRWPAQVVQDLKRRYFAEAGTARAKAEIASRLATTGSRAGGWFGVSTNFAPMIKVAGVNTNPYLDVAYRVPSLVNPAAGTLQAPKTRVH